MYFELSEGDIEEKQQQIQDLRAEVERLTTEHAKTAEQLSYEVNRVAKYTEEMRQTLQNQFDTTLATKTDEYVKLKEHLASLRETFAKEVCIKPRWFLLIVTPDP